MNRQSPRLRPVFVTAIAAALLALHWALALSALARTGATNDEPIHLASGYSYWRFDDYRMQPENGNLPQRWGALPLLLLRPRLEPGDDPVLWGASHQWRISYGFFFRSGNDADTMLFCARAAMGLWTVATGLLVFAWARAQWGDAGGLFSLAAYSFSPTMLAHGALVTSDMCAAFWLLAAVGAWWRVSRRITWGRLALSCAVTGLAFVAKYSAILLFPVFGLLLVWRVLDAEAVVLDPAFIAPAPRVIGTRRGKLAALAALGALHALAAWAVIWTFFGWRYGAFAPSLPPAWTFYIPTDVVLARHDLVTRAVAAAMRWRLLPEAYLQGFAHVRYQGSARAAFLLGQYAITGWWWFFPYAFWAKSTFGELLVAGALLYAAARRWLQPPAAVARLALIRGDVGRLAPLLALGAVYGGGSLLSTLNIGQRHILPLYPILFILGGALVRAAAGRWWRIAAVAALGLSAVESASIRPHYLAFFNALAGGPGDGWRQLVDSSLDWGQDLPELARWVRAHRRPGEPVYLSYFGSGSPDYEGLPARDLSPYYSSGRPRSWYELHAGLYCVSATLLQDVYSPYRGLWKPNYEAAYRALLPQMRSEIAAGTRRPELTDFARGPVDPLWTLDRLRFARLVQYLRLRRPDAVIGYSIFVYRLAPEEVRVAVDGTPDELAAMMTRAAAAR